MISNIAFTSKVICKTEGITAEEFVENMVQKKSMINLENLLKSLEEGPDEDTIEFTFNCPGKKVNSDSTVSAKFRNTECGEETIKLKNYNDDLQSSIPLNTLINDNYWKDNLNEIQKQIRNIKELVKSKIDNVKAGQRSLNKYFNVK
jgi:hypothetical protein